MSSSISAPQYIYLKNGNIKYRITVRHGGLSKYRDITGTDVSIALIKAKNLAKQWDEQWDKKVQQKAAKREKEKKLKNAQKGQDHAEKETTLAQKALQNIRETLIYTLSVNDEVNWDSLKDKSPFNKPKPKPMMCPEVPVKPESTKLTPMPKETDQEYQPVLSFLDNIFKSRREAKILHAKSLFKTDLNNWENDRSKISEYDAAQLIKYNQDMELWEDNKKRLDDVFKTNFEKWENQKARYKEKQKKANEKIDELKKKYLAVDPDAIIECCDIVLTQSQYPDEFPQEFELDYNPETKILIVDYSLPWIEHVPKLKEVKYVKSQDDFKEKELSERELNKLYDDLLYQISIRTIHELYEADVIEAFGSIVFNGWVRSIEKATGQEVNACILTLQANRDEFLVINLELVDPKSCFRNLKGIGSSKLHSLASVAPLLTINKEDSRFVSSYDVADALDDSVNLAAMDWEDFEHLIRELFEKEFKQGGGEVKVTQASRDGGVDAIAFDPDPIRGGKIVIQAKRYTNTVGVSAVRDLYGTTLNEGAIKGILITTSDYGPDAYGFAKGKPLTLLNGNNLLHLLEKHGHKAKIDIQEAKQLLADA